MIVGWKWAIILVAILSAWSLFWIGRASVDPQPAGYHCVSYGDQGATCTHLGQPKP